MNPPILNPEPGRFICRGPGARVNADILAEFERDRGLKVEVLDANSRALMWSMARPIERAAQRFIAEADVIIDVIP